MTNTELLDRAVEALIQLNQKKASEAEWGEALENFYHVLRTTEEKERLSELLEQDLEDNLPIVVKTAAFERLLEIGPRTSKVLRLFADHLWFHGPSSDDLVESLRAEADVLDNAS